MTSDHYPVFTRGINITISPKVDMNTEDSDRTEKDGEYLSSLFNPTPPTELSSLQLSS